MKGFLRAAAVLIIVFLFTTVGYYLYDSLRPRTVPERLAAVLHYEDRRLLSNELIDFLKDESPEVRQRAALAIGRIGSPGGADLLYNNLFDSSIDVAATIAFAVGLTGDSEAIQPLLDAALDLPVRAAAQAVEAAGRLADSSEAAAIEQILGFLAHAAPEVREAACRGLAWANARRKAADIAAAMTTETDEQVKQVGLYTLARLATAQGVPLYVEFLADPDPFHRATALRGLGRSNSPDADHYLAIALNDGDPEVVAQAVSELGRRDSDEARSQLVRRLQRERNPKLLAALLKALKRQENELGIATAREILTRQPPAHVTAAAVEYLAAVEGDRAMAVVDSVMRGADPYLLAACTRALAKIGTEKIVTRVAVLFGHEDPMVRTAALEALVTLDTANRAFYLNQALADRDFVVAATALEQIKNFCMHRYLPAIDSLMAARPDVDVRRAALGAAEALAKDGVNDSLVRAALTKGILDREYVVRLDAARSYHRLFGQNHFGAVPPAPTRLSRRGIESALESYQSNPYATIVTNRGHIEVELLFDVAPLTVLNFIDLAEDDFYRGLIFHRVVPAFVVQGGDPRGDGWGGPDYFIRCEYSPQPYRRGAVGIATSGKDTGGSQFFITLLPQPHLESRYTLFGQVISGMDVIEQLDYGDVIEDVLIRER